MVNSQNYNFDNFDNLLYIVNILKTPIIYEINNELSN